MSQQTAVDWLIEEIKNFYSGRSQYYSKTAIYNHAYRMEKEQIEWAWVNGKISMMNKENKSSEEYYKENYGTEMPNL